MLRWQRPINCINGEDIPVSFLLNHKTCCLLLNEDFAFVNEKRDGTVVVDVLSPDDTADLFLDPCSSKLFNIVYVGSFERTKWKLMRIENLDRKAVCLPYQDGFAIFPLLHAVEK